MGRPGAECGAHTPLSAESRTVTKTLRPVLALLLLPVVVMLAMPAEASVNAFWKELGGSATGGAVSQLAAAGDGQRRGRHGRRRRPADRGLHGLHDRRGRQDPGQALDRHGVADDQPGHRHQRTGGIGGEDPQLVISPAGTFFVAWSTREAGRPGAPAAPRRHGHRVGAARRLRRAGRPDRNQRIERERTSRWRSVTTTCRSSPSRPRPRSLASASRSPATSPGSIRST